MNWLGVHELLNWVMRLAMIPIVLQRRRTTSAATAWLLVIFFYPWGGILLYLLFGSTRLGKRRIGLQRAMLEVRRSLERLKVDSQDQEALAMSYPQLARQAEKISGFPVVGGNAFSLCSSAPEFIRQLIADIDAATDHVHLLFYIFCPDATGRQVADALLCAANRGVKCRVLADALGSRRFFKRHGLASELKRGGVEVATAMSIWRVSLLLPRVDLRNHRKLAVIDARTAWVGSQNITDADYGGRKGGPWFDLMMRLSGPVIAELQAVFLEDWLCETKQELTDPALLSVSEPAANVPAQVVATGPTEIEETFRRVVIAAVGAAKRDVLLTTPYFAPDEATQLALLMAADRGVDVTLIVPAIGDHAFTAAAGRASFGPLLDAGCVIHQFLPGLLHTKSITVDEEFALVSSANLDMRSFNLNFELGVLLYDPQAAEAVREVQLQYIAQSHRLEREVFQQRSWPAKLTDDICGLVSPLL